MRKKMALSVVVIALTMLLSFGAALDQANADALLFPWVVKSTAISTIVSVVNTAAINPLFPPFTGTEQLHWSYFYKDDGSGGLDNSQTASCVDLDFKMNTSQMDVVTVDCAGNINGGLPMFGDTNNALSGGVSAALSAPGDRRAFLIVDNNTPIMSLPGQLNNIDTTLYGEAMIIEISTGAAWGYVAYNAGGPFGDPINSPGMVGTPMGATCAGGQNGFVSFSNGIDPHGEVIGGFWPITENAFPVPDTVTLATGSAELAPVVLLPPSDILTRFFLTPVDMINAAFAFADAAPDPDNCGPTQWANQGQRHGNINARVGVCARPVLCGPAPLPACNFACGSVSGICLTGNCALPGITLNDESPLSSTKLKNIVCTSADDIGAMLDAGTMVSWTANGGQAWTYMRPTMGNMLPATSYAYTPNMMIGKLDWIDGGANIDGTAAAGTFNNFLHVRNNKDNIAFGPNSVPWGINNLVPLP